jgi:hypothetical protein
MLNYLRELGHVALESKCVTQDTDQLKDIKKGRCHERREIS